MGCPCFSTDFSLKYPVENVAKGKCMSKSRPGWTRATCYYRAVTDVMRTSMAKTNFIKREKKGNAISKKGSARMLLPTDVIDNRFTLNNVVHVNFAVIRFSTGTTGL